MSQKLMLYAVGIWFLFMFLAIVNAVIREGFYGPKIGDWGGHVVSTIILILLIFLVVYLFLSGITLEYSRRDLFLIGLIWVLATISFEFLAGHYIFGNSWEKLLRDYNILAGRVWSLVLIAIFSAPILIDKLIS